MTATNSTLPPDSLAEAGRADRSAYAQACWEQKLARFSRWVEPIWSLIQRYLPPSALRLLLLRLEPVFRLPVSCLQFPVSSPWGSGRYLWRGILPATLALALLAPSLLALADDPQPVGPEFRVNTFTTGSQIFSSVAVDADGDFVVAWESEGQDGGGFGVYAQRYNASGVAQGSEFRVNTYTTDLQRYPSVAIDADGDFVVVWESGTLLGGGQDGSGYGVYAQRYNASGVPQGGEFRVNTYTTRSQSNPRVAVDADGDFVVVWQSSAQDDSFSIGVYAQRYNASGVPQGSEFRVNTFTIGSQSSPSVGMDADGDFVITWDSYGQDGSEYGVYAQRYNANGVAQGGEFRVNSFTTGNQEFSRVAMDAAGDFVVAWDSYGQDGSNYGVYAQRYNASGVPQGSEFRVNTLTTSNQNGAIVAMDADGDFVVAWSHYSQAGSGVEVYGRRYNASGVPQGSEFQINTFTTNHQSSSGVAMDADGDFVVAWDSYGQDGSEGGVYVRRYTIEFRVTSFTTDSQRLPSVAVDADGAFVVAWQSIGQDGSGFGVYAQRYNASGVAQGGEFRVNTFITSDQNSPSVAMDADGDFIIAWESSGQDGSGAGVYARRYKASGVPQGPEFQVNIFTTDFQSSPSVAMDADGDFVVTWQSFGQDGSSYGVYGRRYNAGGVAQGGEFRVNTFTTNRQSTPSVAVDADGDFVIVWDSAGQDGNSYGVYGQRYKAGGVPQGSEFRVNTFTANGQEYPRVAMDTDGDFVVTWESFGQDGSGFGVYGQRYNAGGAAQGNEFRVNTHTINAQRLPSVALDAVGNFVITWGSSDQDGNGFGVYGQRYNAGGAAQGNEFQVNVHTSNDQTNSGLAVSANGSFVVAWASSDQDSSFEGVYARRYPNLNKKAVYLPLLKKNGA